MQQKTRSMIGFLISLLEVLAYPKAYWSLLFLT